MDLDLSVLPDFDPNVTNLAMHPVLTTAAPTTPNTAAAVAAATAAAHPATAWHAPVNDLAPVSLADPLADLSAPSTLLALSTTAPPAHPHAQTAAHPASAPQFLDRIPKAELGTASVTLADQPPIMHTSVSQLTDCAPDPLPGFALSAPMSAPVPAVASAVAPPVASLAPASAPVLPASLAAMQAPAAASPTASPSRSPSVSPVLSKPKPRSRGRSVRALPALLDPSGHNHPTPFPDTTVKKARTTMSSGTAARTGTLLRAHGGAASTAELSTEPELDPHTVCQMGGLPYARLCRERAREEFKDAKRNEHLANGNIERTTRRKKNDTSMSKHDKYKRRLGMNQDSAAAARHAQEVYINVLEKLVKLSEAERKTFTAVMQRIRQQNATLNQKVDELESKLHELNMDCDAEEPSQECVDAHEDEGMVSGDATGAASEVEDADNMAGDWDKTKDSSFSSKLLDFMVGANADLGVGIQPARAV